MTTKRELHEIEIALARLKMCDFTKNLVVFNVNGTSSIFQLDHECDVLVCSKAGYLTEIEIKRSWEDFKADFKKRCYHNHCGLIKYFYYCVSELFADKVIDYLKENEIECDGVLVYNEEGKFNFSICDLDQSSPERCSINKLFIEQKLYLASLGAMREISVRERLVEDSSNARHVRTWVDRYEPKKDISHGTAL